MSPWWGRVFSVCWVRQIHTITKSAETTVTRPAHIGSRIALTVERATAEPHADALYMAAPHNKNHARGYKPTAFFGVEGVIITSLRTSTCCLVSDCKFEFARFIYAKDKTWVNVFPLCMCRLSHHNPQADGWCRKGRHCKNTKKDLNHWWKRKKICCDAPVMSVRTSLTQRGSWC